MKQGFKDWLTQASAIKKNCQPFLQMTEQPLYRGVDFPFMQIINSAKIQTVNKDRAPRDSSVIAHTLIDDWFNKHYHIRPRSQGLFCTGEPRNAEKYGRLCYVFPVGNFKFVWGTRINKGHSSISDTIFLSREISDLMRVREKTEGEATVDAVMQQVKWHFGDLEEAQGSGAEIVILCDEVIIVPVQRAPDYNKFIQEL